MTEQPPDSPQVQDAGAGVGEPEPALSSKEARRRRRSTSSGEAGPARSPQERQTERNELRREKARQRSAYRTKARARRAERRAGESPAPPQEPVARPAGARKVALGVVVSDRADKTITVRVDLTRRHRRYQKTIRSSSTLHAHDEANEARAGDTVRVVESRPRSRTKRWRLVEVVERVR